MLVDSERRMVREVAALAFVAYISAPVVRRVSAYLLSNQFRKDLNDDRRRCRECFHRGMHERWCTHGR